MSDVVVVGGGIAGGALGFALAREGLEVTVLEATTEYLDKVRGESLMPWGVAEARDLGVEDPFRAAGAHTAPVWKQFVAGVGEAGEIPVGSLLPGIPGSLNLRHPVACQVLADAAAAAGVTFVRGVRGVQLLRGPPTEVRYTVDGATTGVLSAGLVVGADGRASTVRKQVGVTLERQEAVNHIAGLLVDGLDGVPDDFDALVSGERFLVLFHQGGGRARVYLVTGESSRRQFAGHDAAARFLGACANASFPWAELLGAAVPAGPCATYPGDDTWTDGPYVDGVVLVGDAAGHNDPIIGQGLSIALRDARIVRDLVLEGARTADALAPYGAERVERMRRLRLIADVISATEAEDADNRPARRAYVGERMAAMDPTMFPLLVGSFAGPETVPAELVDPRVLDVVRAA